MNRLDLSGLKVCLNGAEPGWAGTLERFYETFAPAGLSAGALSPGYGLAEARRRYLAGALSRTADRPRPST